MILASKSPRRKEILEGFGFNIKIQVPDIEEVSDKEKIVEQIEDIAKKKCEEIAKTNNKEFIIAADTVVLIGDQLLGKPKTKKEASEMLISLSGKKHKVITAYCILHKEKGIEKIAHNVTEVEFKKLSNEIIQWYIDTEEPMDKAGSYGIQGKGSVLIKEIKGDFFSVMGMPLSDVVNDFLELGITLEELKNI